MWWRAPRIPEVVPPPTVVEPVDNESYTLESESSNVRARAATLSLQRTLQRTATSTRDEDGVCNVCVFGLMGHGKSRFLNLILTAMPPANTLLSADVPSGDASTTRAYGAYSLPLYTRLGRAPFSVVDTIGVKFADETHPSDAEIQREFALVERQLRALDFRGRVGAFAQTYEVGIDRVLRGEDIIEITDVSPTGSGVDRKEAGATVTLRGGTVLKNVPMQYLCDPDGKNWEYTPQRGFVDKRGLIERLQHWRYGLPYFQPKCHAVILVTNPHVHVTNNVVEQWRAVFHRHGFSESIAVATHADTAWAGDQARQEFDKATKRLEKLQETCTGQAKFVHRVESYSERPEGSSLELDPSERRWLSEAHALDAVYRACEYAQNSTQRSRGGDTAAVVGLVAAVGIAFLVRGRLRAKALLRRK